MPVKSGEALLRWRLETAIDCELLRADEGHGCLQTADSADETRLSLSR